MAQFLTHNQVQDQFHLPMSVQVFSWLLMLDKLNVRNILRRKKFKVEGNDYSCPLYPNNHEETTFHHFFLCPFSLDCCHHLGINWDFSLGFHNMMEKARRLWPHAFIMECFILGAWLIWKQRNNAIFNRERPSLLSWKKGFLEEASLQAHRLSSSKKPLFLDIVNTFR
jgi:hypothetical protein